jgi:hypothetical protein
MKISNLAKKVLGALVAVGIVAGMLIPATGVLADPNNSVTLTVPTSVAPGQTFNVTMDIKTALEVRGWQFDITYDPAVLTFNAPPVEGTFIKTFAGAGNTYFNPGTAGSGTLTAFADAQTGGPAGGATGTGTLVTLSFTVAAGAMPTASTIHIVSATASLSDQSANNITSNFTLNDGTVNVVWPTPTITSLNQMYGGSGVSITINGTNMTGATAVKFGGVAAAISSNTATKIVAVVGTGATGSVTVTNPGGTATLAGFTYVASPVVSSIAPLTGTTGQSVTVTGSGFATVTGNVQSVTVGGVALTGVNTVNDTTITGLIAAGTPVSVTDPVVVNTYGGASNNTITFNYFAPSGSIGLSPVAVTSDFVSPFTVNVVGSTQSPTAMVRGWSATITYDPSKVSFTGVAGGTDANNLATALSMTYWMSPASVNTTTGTITIGGAFLGGDPTKGVNIGASPVLAVLTFQPKAPADMNNPPAPMYLNVTNPVIVDYTATNISNVLVGTSAVVTFQSTPICPLPTTPANQSATMNIPATLAPTLTFIAPWDVCCWNLVPSQKNMAQRTMTVFSNAKWEIMVSGTNGGYMTNSALKLANPLQVSSTAGTGTGNNVTVTGAAQILATGDPTGQQQCIGGDLRTLTFTQPVLWTDKPSTTGYYSITTFFTAICTGW